MSNFYFFAYAALGKGLSGGDRIFIELARRWCLENDVNIYLWSEGYEMCKRQNLTSSKILFKVSKMEPWRRMGFILNYLARIIQGITTGLKLNLENNSNTVVYSASEFWMDSLPAFVLKLRFPRIKWVAAWFQTAPNPLKGFSTNERKEKYRFNALAYFLMQFPIKRLIIKKADFVLVNNEDEKKEFRNLDRKGRVIVCLGAVDLDSVHSFKKEFTTLPKVYDGVFQGRFHPQKGILELIQIWEQVIEKFPKAKLALIGDGPLMSDVKKEIAKLNLRKNIKLFGYMFDGEEKYRIFSQSKIVLHPSFYDSGGMAAAEAMAFGLPGVCFNLKSLESYYPKGMLKAKVEDLSDFSGKVALLLSDVGLYKKLSKEAKIMIEMEWGWEKRANQILKGFSK